MSHGSCFLLGAGLAPPASAGKRAKPWQGMTLWHPPLWVISLSLKCTMLQAQPLFLCSAFPVIPPLYPPEGGRMVCELLCPPTASAHPQPCTHTAPSCCWESPALSHPNPLDRLLFPAPLCKQADIPWGWERPGTTLLFSLEGC